MHEQVVILGPGLLGGSLALALARSGQSPLIWGRRQAPLDHLRALEPERLRVTPILEEALDGASFVVLATPIGVMPDLLRTMATEKNLAPKAIVTDVGSVKGPIVDEAHAILAQTSYRFVGSHPMAGSEASGVEAARDDLFRGAMCLLTPLEETDREAVDLTRQFWTNLECRVHELDPRGHDRVVAHVSHMPHAVASLVVHAALGQDTEWAQFSGGGLHDTTRIASGEPGMWTEILEENREAVLEALRGAEKRLQELIESMESRENRAVHRFLLEAKELRDTHIAHGDR